VTDWQAIRTAICEGRRFALTEQGAKVMADTIMPSGMAINIHIEQRASGLFLHDGCAAFDELARHGLGFSKDGLLAGMLRKTNFGVSEGMIFRDKVAMTNIAVGIAITADASFRAATYMLENADSPKVKALDVRVRDALRLRYPMGRPNFVVEGKNRQHTFDFGVVLNGETVLVEAVIPDAASINAAIVKALDVAQSDTIKARPVFVYDPLARWKSGQLSLLNLGGRSIEAGQLESATPLLAA
jgi:hypothetical protein